jgi:DNA-binding transcriptional regulator LsrR (DeoR family)
MEDETGHVNLLTLYLRVLLELSRRPRISQETLARRLDVTMRTAQRHLTELEEEGYIHVDRTKKPFEYSIDWSRQWPYLEDLRLVLFHPQVAEPLRGLSDVAYRTYETAANEKADPSQALHEAFHAERKGVDVA